MTVHDIELQKLIRKAAIELKKISEITPPNWAPYVKTGAHKQRPPSQKDWWYLRTASILRKIYLLGPIGTNKLRKKYGGLKGRGHRPEEFRRGSGSIIRKSLQQLQKAGLVTQTQIKGHKGRVLTPKGKAFLDKLSKQENA